MRILYLCPDYGIPLLGGKGASVHVRAMAAAFRRAGHSVTVAGPMLTKSPEDEAEPLDAQVLHLPAGDATDEVYRELQAYVSLLGAPDAVPREVRRLLYDRELAELLVRRFHKAPPDFIYARASLYGTACAVAAMALDRPLLVELNAPLAQEQGNYRGGGMGDLGLQAERFLLGRADAVLAVSAPLAEHARRLGADPARTHVFPNGVDPLLFHPGAPDPAVRRRYNLGAGPVLGFVGGLRPWHGVCALPPLLERLSRRYPGLRLVIAGEGPLRSDLEREIAQLRLADRVRFTGALPHREIAPLMRCFDIALAPYEPLDHEFYFSPLKLFEYMGCGAAVVAAQSGQIAEVVRHGETGLLYPAGDLERLLLACERLLTDGDLRRRLGRQAAAAIQENYTWDHNARRAAELAQAIAASRRTAGALP